MTPIKNDDWIEKCAKRSNGFLALVTRQNEEGGHALLTLKEMLRAIVNGYSNDAGWLKWIDASWGHRCERPGRLNGKFANRSGGRETPAAVSRFVMDERQIAPGKIIHGAKTLAALRGLYSTWPFAAACCR